MRHLPPRWHGTYHGFERRIHRSMGGDGTKIVVVVVGRRRGGGGGTDDVDYEALRTSDLPYQRDDDLMMHDSSVLAVDVSNDGTLLGTTSSNGTVCVWKLKDGRMLRKLERAHGGIVGPGGGDGGEFFFSFFPPLRERSAAFYGNIHFVSVEWNSVSNSMVPYTHARIIRTRTHPQGPP